jgi:hypothetical protein
MLAELVAATESLKAAGQIAVGLIDLKTTTEVQAKAIELNQKILAAQNDLFAANAAQAALIERVRELEREVARMKHWDTQKQRYKLAAPFSGCMVYALQKSMSNGEPPHYLCAACYQNGKPSILQGKTVGAAGISLRNAFYQCATCKSEAITRWTNIPTPQYFEDIQSACT